MRQLFSHPFSHFPIPLSPFPFTPAVMDIAWKLPIYHADVDKLHEEFEAITSDSGKGQLGDGSQKAIGMDVLGGEEAEEPEKKRGFLGLW